MKLIGSYRKNMKGEGELDGGGGDQQAWEEHRRANGGVDGVMLINILCIWVKYNETHHDVEVIFAN